MIDYRFVKLLYFLSRPYNAYFFHATISLDMRIYVFENITKTEQSVKRFQMWRLARLCRFKTDNTLT